MFSKILKKIVTVAYCIILNYSFSGQQTNFIIQKVIPEKYVYEVEFMNVQVEFHEFYYPCKKKKKTTLTGGFQMG